jgi:hypothetical protein
MADISIGKVCGVVATCPIEGCGKLHICTIPEDDNPNPGDQRHHDGAHESPSGHCWDDTGLHWSDGNGSTFDFGVAKVTDYRGATFMRESLYCDTRRISEVTIPVWRLEGTGRLPDAR